MPVHDHLLAVGVHEIDRRQILARCESEPSLRTVIPCGRRCQAGVTAHRVGLPIDRDVRGGQIALHAVALLLDRRLCLLQLGIAQYHAKDTAALTGLLILQQERVVPLGGDVEQVGVCLLDDGLEQQVFAHLLEVIRGRIAKGVGHIVLVVIELDLGCDTKGCVYLNDVCSVIVRPANSLILGRSCRSVKRPGRRCGRAKRDRQHRHGQRPEADVHRACPISRLLSRWRAC
ncbi:hypothetical protein D3C71_1349010 [compost metagenome]